MPISNSSMRHPISLESSIAGLWLISFYQQDGSSSSWSLNKLPSMIPSVVDAFEAAASTRHHAVRDGTMRWVGRDKRTVNHLNFSNDHSKSDEEFIAGCDTSLTSAIIKCAYDGTYFRGWTAGNSDLKNDHQTQYHDGKSENKNNDKHPPRRKQTRRSRTLQRKGGGYGIQHGRVRTVDDTIRFTLAKVYGNIDANRITIESCSRTDAGVHAQALVAQFYCTKTSSSPTTAMTTSRPNSHDDASNFLPLPFGSDLSKLVFVLNRMLPPDVRILAASPLPTNKQHYINNMFQQQHVPFHPALHSMSKTYMYKFAIGEIHDPLQTQYVWHLDGSSNRAVGMNGNRFRLEHALAAANLFVDSHDENMNAGTAISRDYRAFRSAFRGTDRGRIQSTMCKLWKCEIVQERRKQLPSWEIGVNNATGEFEDRNVHQGSRLHDDGPRTYKVIIMGDRFLYKMIRNIVGTIVAVGCGHLELDDVRVALNVGGWDGNSDGLISQTRRICAPARGLTLVDVKYPREIEFNWQTG